MFGSYLPHAISGLLVLAMVALDGAGRVRPGVVEQARVGDDPPCEQRASAPDTLPSSASSRSSGSSIPPLTSPAPSEDRLGNRIFIPVLTIPAVTIAFAATFRILSLDVNRGALIGLGFGGVAAMIVAPRLTRSSSRTMCDDGRPLNECMGPVNILPQLLASLGVIFAAAGVGQLVAGYVVQIVPRDSLFLLVLANCLAMFLFTIVMGNSFAAFPVIA